jgi:hypothetical protein
MEDEVPPEFLLRVRKYGLAELEYEIREFAKVFPTKPVFKPSMLRARSSEMEYLARLEYLPILKERIADLEKIE